MTSHASAQGITPNWTAAPIRRVPDDLFGMQVMIAVAIAYIASGIGQYALRFGIPPFVGEIAAQLLLFSVLVVCLTTLTTDDALLTKGFAVISGLIALSFLWMLASFLYSSESKVALGALVQNARATLLMMSVALAVAYIPASFRAISLCAIGLVGLGCLVNIYDFIQPTFSDVPGRAAGFYINPNIAGSMLIYLALLGCLSTNIKWTYILWSVTTIGVVLTFSRSAWLLLFFALIGLTLVGKLGTGRGRIVFVAGTALLLAIAFATLVSGDLYTLVSQSRLSEYLNPNTIARLGASGSAVEDFSVMERQSALTAGWEAFLNSPIFGQGLGYTFEWSGRVSTHNMFVLFLAERGVIGFLLYVSTLVALLVLTRGPFRLMAVILVMEGFFTHNQLDEMSHAAVVGTLIGSVALGRHPVIWRLLISGRGSAVEQS